MKKISKRLLRQKVATFVRKGKSDKEIKAILIKEAEIDLTPGENAAIDDLNYIDDLGTPSRDVNGNIQIDLNTGGGGTWVATLKDLGAYFNELK